LPLPAAVPLPSLVDGRAIDPDGNPVAAASVVVAGPEYFDDRTNAVPPSWASFGTADKDGHFRLAVFAPSGPTMLGGYTANGELYGLTNLTLLPGLAQVVD